MIPAQLHSTRFLLIIYAVPHTGTTEEIEGMLCVIHSILLLVTALRHILFQKKLKVATQKTAEFGKDYLSLDEETTAQT